MDLFLDLVKLVRLFNNMICSIKNYSHQTFFLNQKQKIKLQINNDIIVSLLPTNKKLLVF